MRYVSCDLCGAGEPVVVAETGRLGLPVRTVACTRCGLVYTNPLRELADYDGADAEKVRKLMRPAGRPSEKYLAKSGLRAASAARFLDDVLGEGVRALDVGCAAGRLLLLAQQRGCTVEGVEPEAEFARLTREALGCEVHECLLEQAPLAPGSFDLITASHVLEHTDSPVAFLTRAHELLAPGGHVFIEVPNVLQPRCSLRRVFHVAHRYNFTGKTLAFAARRAGFAIVRSDELTGPGVVQVLGRNECSASQPDPERDGEDYRVILDALRRHRWRYYASGMFIRRKLGPAYAE